MHTTKSRMLIAVGHKLTRSALRLFLEEAPGLEVVGEVDDNQALLAEVGTKRPNIVLLGPDVSGPPLIALLPALRALDRRLIVIVLSGRPELECDVQAAGADAFLNLCDPPRCLLTTLQAMREGRRTE